MRNSLVSVSNSQVGADEHVHLAALYRLGRVVVQRRLRHDEQVLADAVELRALVRAQRRGDAQALQAQRRGDLADLVADAPARMRAAGSVSSTSNSRASRGPRSLPWLRAA